MIEDDMSKKEANEVRINKFAILKLKVNEIKQLFKI